MSEEKKFSKTPRHLVPKRIREVNALLKSGEFKNVADACAKVGLSPATFYRYAGTKKTAKKSSKNDTYDSLLEAMVTARQAYVDAKMKFSKFVLEEGL